MSFGRIFFLVCLLAGIAALVYTGAWQAIPLFLWQHPMLSWLPLLAFLVVGLAAGTVRLLASNDTPALAEKPADLSESAGKLAGQNPETASSPAPTASGAAETRRGPRLGLWFGPGFLAFAVVLVLGLWFTLISPRTVSLDQIDYEVVDTLPQRTQPRLLPRAGVSDDPAFADTKETHLLRDPRSGELLWTGEWQSSLLGRPSAGVAIRPLDDVINESEIQQTGFDHSVAGITPPTLKGQAKIDHPFSRMQYPILVPDKEGEAPTAFAIAPYVGYEGFPFPQPFLKGVLVYHQDGTIEDLTPEEAASRPELVRTGRIVPEDVARAQAEALADSDEIDGKIVDGKGNSQPFLTSIDRDRTAWLTIIDSKNRGEGVKALVIADSSTGETQVWKPPADRPLISAESVLNRARALPLRWEESRCCDSEGGSYTVTLRQVVEPRLAFKDGKPYYLVTVIPTKDLALSRDVEYTLLIDAETGKELDRFEHVSGGLKEDVRLQAFFN